jgi:hypothetical protein
VLAVLAPHEPLPRLQKVLVWLHTLATGEGARGGLFLLSGCGGIPWSRERSSSGGGWRCGGGSWQQILAGEVSLDLGLGVDDAHGAETDVTLRERLLAVWTTEHHRLLPAGRGGGGGEGEGEEEGRADFLMEVEDW